jgi:hypothetical protein
MDQNREEGSKKELKEAIAATNNVEEKVVTLDDLKEIDEEVQYAIAKPQSHLNARSKEAYLLYLILLVAFLNANSSGFDDSLIGSINAISQYKNFSHLKETGSSTDLILIPYNAASTFGCAFGSPVMDYFGRRGGMQS